MRLTYRLQTAAFSAMLAFACPLAATAQETWDEPSDLPFQIQQDDSFNDLWDEPAQDQPPEEEPVQQEPTQAGPVEPHLEQGQIEQDKPAPAPKVERVANPVAEFTGIDKITGRIITFDVYIDETVQFGALQVTPRVCYSRPAAEEPKTDSFVEVDEITLDRKIRRIFTGWMFAESPGLNAVEHPVYDVWLTACKQKSDVPPPESVKAPATETVPDSPSSKAKPAG
jgi:hypothetical protein